MLSEHRRAFATSVNALDLSVLVAALATAIWTHDGTPSTWLYRSFEVILVSVVWLTMARRLGLYLSRRTGSLIGEIWLLAQMLTLVAGVFLVVRAAIGRPIGLDAGLWFSVGLGGTAGMRLLVRPLLWALRRRGINTRSYLFVGRGDSAHRMAESIRSRREFGINVVGELTFNGEETRTPIAGAANLGTTADLQDVLKQHSVDEIVVCPSDGVWATEVKSLLRFCSTTGLCCRLAPDCLGVPLTPGAIDFIGEVATFSLPGGFGDRRSLWAKRLIDIAGAGVGLLLLAPLMTALAVAIKLGSRGPVLFRQTRVGVNGRLFTMFKYRSMVADAEALRSTLEKDNEQAGPVFKMTRDPRVTRIGAFLRRYSLDELPQLINVLRGDMSLVGPRPPIPSEVVQYDWWQRRRLSVRPGLTCIWQVSGRNSVGFDEWMQMDLAYIDGWNLALDMKIMAKTVKEVIRGGGA